MSAKADSTTDLIEEVQEKLEAMRREMGQVLVGQQELIDSLFIALLADGHLLIEGVPGLAKTLAVKTLSQVLSCDFARIQFTPDLLPADLIGTSIYNPKDGTFTVKKGPVFTNLVLADEINRAPAKVQSALLEVMEERQVTIAGDTFKVDEPYLVLATQNPIEQEGTYPLPEAQTDRFLMKVVLNYPSREQEREILDRMARIRKPLAAKAIVNGKEILQMRRVIDQIYVDEKITNYLLDVVLATREPSRYNVPIEGLLDYGASPRASLSLTLCAKAHAVLQGRGYVTPHDIKKVALPVLRHRLCISYEAEAEGETADSIIEKILATLQVP